MEYHRLMIGRTGVAFLHLPGIQWQDEWEWFKAAPGEVQTGHKEEFLYQAGGQTLELAS